MRILVACEESQALTNRFRELGHEAFSCDILPCSGGHPEWHLQQDVSDLLNQKWDMIIAFPPCTYLTVTGNRWFNIDLYGEKAVQRHKDREEAIKFFLKFADADCDFIAIENPVGIMSSEWRKPDQIINPYEFGDPYEKKTCLWLKRLPPLKATNVVKPEPRKEFKSCKTMPGRYAYAWKLPKDERAKLRSKTFQGIAQAMTTQWTNFISKQFDKHDY
jgi:site-specific DNA-cytosine methylase